MSKAFSSSLDSAIARGPGTEVNIFGLVYIVLGGGLDEGSKLDPVTVAMLRE